MQKFLIILSFAEASVLEIESVVARQKLKAQIEQANQSAVLVASDERTARILLGSLGGSYKIGRYLGNSLSSAMENIDLPYETKFNWTVSGYECGKELRDEAREGVHELLKSKRLGKLKFIEPDIVSSRGKGAETSIGSEELRVSQLRDRVLSHGGIDLIIHGGISGAGGPNYAETIETIDTKSFESRDFGRPFQDPKKTVSPRIARLLANLSLGPESRSLLDPFCGLGTVLQEALLCGASVVGVDRDQALVDKARANLAWLASEYKIGPKLKMNLFAYDARRVSRARMPRVDAIASEPLLVPVFSTNPPASKAIDSIEKARAAYERSLGEFSSVLSGRESRIAITAPAVIDSSGKARIFDLAGVASDCGFKSFLGRTEVTREIRYPLRIPSRKKKNVQRNLYVFYLGSS